jgi:predicted nucleic acid-binding Zn ribbon protein
MDDARSVLPTVLAGAIRQAPLTPEKVTFAWRQAGGAAIARATAVSLADGVLAVSCGDPQWAREVHRIRHELLRHLELWLGPGVVTRIDVAGGAETRGRRRRRPASRTSGA